ncbi:MAG TPA: alpha/beta fold hydrolase [Solirubrobacteraceae bacterium]|nr:alpha/beta fold hydrolase [Solirubrobacteraceae bacterium]
MTARVADWWAGGERLPLVSGHELFVRTAGEPGRPWMTLLHGFPTSSWDWAPLAARLETRFRLATLDFLGFGDSDKPPRHRYSLLEQADAVEALWRRAGVGETAIVAHDYGLSVAQELLARRREGRLQTHVSHVALLNGGAIPGLHRPTRLQRLLAAPASGPLLSRLASERTFTRGLAAVFATPPPREHLHEHWLAMSRRDGHRRAHALLAYIAERRVHAGRWTGALAAAGVPLKLIWGPLDPVSGAHMLAGLRRLVPAADVVELPGAGHYPQLEAVDAVAAALV